MSDICTVYSNSIDFQLIIDEIKKHYPKANISVDENSEAKTILISIKNGFFSFAKKLKIVFRQRKNPSYKLEKPECPLSQNLIGMYGFVSKMPSQNELLKDLLLRKIETLNSEFSIMNEQNAASEFLLLAQNLASIFDAIVFAQPKTQISKANSQHFLDKNLNLILDSEGNNGIDNLEVKINAVFYDQNETEYTENQKLRKSNTEKVLIDKKINVNVNLPCIVDENSVKIRTEEEIKTRIVALALTNLVAFNTISKEEAQEYVKHWKMESIFTPLEISFLEDPTDDRKDYETWKCECIWTLMWALNIVDDLEFPDHLADLNKIPFEKYPIGPDKNPYEFIIKNYAIRSKSEILDANDLYYRLDWACVNARLQNTEIESVIPGVIYERHYALNWLIHFRDQNWDDITTDT